MFRTIATALVCMLFATVLWADCAPDYRSDKRAGVFIADFIINETSSLDSSQLAAIRSKLIGACADEKTDDLEELVPCSKTKDTLPRQSRIWTSRCLIRSLNQNT
jgi:hypothetical protein